MRLLQYLIPGRTSAGTLTYACAPEDFESYRPLFEASAMATRGAVAHPRGGINWGRAMRSGVIGGFVGLVMALVLAAKKKNATVPAPAGGVAPAAPAGWDCPSCKRRVPSRIAECRCGAPRPA